MDHFSPLQIATPEERMDILRAHLQTPRLTLTERQRCDLELLLNGGFSPLRGFLDHTDYESVVNHMRLADGTLWPIPIVLDVDINRTPVQPQDDILLCDVRGEPLALMHVTSVYAPDRIHEAQCVYGTTDLLHAGVRYLLNETHETYLGGTLIGLAPIRREDFSAFRRTPQELRQAFAEQGLTRVIGFQTRNPIHRAHYELMTRAAKSSDAHLLIHPAVGLTKDGDIDYATRVRCYQHVLQTYLPKHSATLSLLPLAMRMAGPREAVWHALIRKNYGCTHFVVGRDHAGPGKNAEGAPFYHPYASRELATSLQHEMGIEIVCLDEIAYVESEHRYLPLNEIPAGAQTNSISGTEFRRKLRAHEPVPDWYSFPEVVAELQRTMDEEQHRGFVIFLTGLPSSGKSTIANMLYARLIESSPKAVTLLDGDIVRRHLSKGLTFSREDREANMERIGFVAGEVAKHGGVAICAAIASYESSRRKNREHISAHGTYVEVYMNTPADVCAQRDVKGLYQKAKAGLITNFTGVNDPYEEPEHADIVLDTTAHSPEACADIVMAWLRDQGLLKRTGRE